MKVKLLKDVVANGQLKAVIRKGRPTIPFVEGAIIEMSEESAKKYIEQGLAEPVKE